jgi:hypothetical protein
MITYEDIEAFMLDLTDVEDHEQPSTEQTTFTDPSEQ